MEMYKVKKDFSPIIFSEVFSMCQQNRFDLRQKLDSAISREKCANHGFERLTYLGPKNGINTVKY